MKQQLRKAGALIIMATGLLSMCAPRAQAHTEHGKVYVCKYVGTPGVDERLQTGQNPIDVSVNAIPIDPVVVGSYFADAQGRSYVLAFDVGQDEPDVSQCPGYVPPTTTTTEVTTSTTDLATTSTTVTTTSTTSTTLPETSTTAEPTTSTTLAPTTTTEVPRETTTTVAAPPTSTTVVVTTTAPRQGSTTTSTRAPGSTSSTTQAVAIGTATHALAYTGSRSRGPVIVGLALLTIGLALLLGSRKRAVR